MFYFYPPREPNCLFGSQRHVTQVLPQPSTLAPINVLSGNTDPEVYAATVVAGLVLPFDTQATGWKPPGTHHYLPTPSLSLKPSQIF